MQRTLLLLFVLAGNVFAESQPAQPRETGAPKAAPAPAFDVAKFLGEIPQRRAARLAGDDPDELPEPAAPGAGALGGARPADLARRCCREDALVIAAGPDAAALAADLAGA